MYKNGSTPKEIRQWLRDNKDNVRYIELSDDQLSNLIQRLNINKTKMSLADANEWCNERTTIPEDPDQVFAAEFHYNSKPSKKEDTYFHIFATTKRLLSFAKFNDLLASDATYKLTYQDYPIIVCGTIDKGKHFHPFGLLLTKTEQERDFAYFFKTVKSMIQAVYDYDYEPNRLLADAADAITNGFKLVYKNLITRLVCWAHVKSNIEKRIKSCDSKYRDEILDDVSSIQSNFYNDHQFQKSI